MQSLLNEDAGVQATPAPLTGRTALLRPLWPADYDFVYHLACSDDVGYRWRFRGMLPDIETFAGGLASESFLQMIALHKETEQRIGHLCAYGVDLRNDTVKLAVVVTPEVQNTGIAMEASFLFVNYLFTNWNFRKIYVEAPSFVLEYYRSALGRVFVEEGRLKEHEYFGGCYWDKLICAIWRHDWDELQARGLRYVQGGAAGTKSPVAVDAEPSVGR